MARWPPLSKRPAPGRSVTARCSFPRSNKPCGSARKKKARAQFESKPHRNSQIERIMKKLLLNLALIAFTLAGVTAAWAQDATNAPAAAEAKPADPTVEQRVADRSEEHTSELQSQSNLVCRL